MSHSLSLLLAALLGLVLAALVSGLLVHHLRRRAEAQARQAALLRALARYALWVARLRSPLGGATPQTGEAGDAEAQAGAREALTQLQALQQLHLPQAEPEMARLRQADAALHDFLASQQALLAHHAEAWLASDHEARLARLALRLQAAVEALETAILPPPAGGLTRATPGGGRTIR